MLKKCFLFLLLSCSTAYAGGLPPKAIKLNDHVQKSDHVELINEIDHANAFDKRQMTCLSLNIYHESRGSPVNDQWAVALVSRNRLNNEKYKDTYCKVIWDYRIKKYPDFSWTVKSVKKLIPYEKESWILAQRIAYLVYNDPDIYDYTNGATHFYNPDIANPSWAQYAVDSMKIGYHMYLVME